MKKIFTIIISITLLAGVFAQFSFQIIIGFGNTPTPNIDSLGDYSVIIYTGEPFATVYIDEAFAGKTDTFGKLVVQFSSEGYHTVWVVSSNQYITYERVIFKVEKQPKYVYVFGTGLGKLTVFSNVYPVYVYTLDGKGAGVIEKRGDSLLVPTGNYKIRLESPGYETLESQVS
ncbi:MAG TPA: PEGA domain-containing protein, partial [Fervidobacterium nodosum]|nr:PEGA domain-containing protein [Fervidobacterium nodosum]